MMKTPRKWTEMRCGTPLFGLEAALKEAVLQIGSP